MQKIVEKYTCLCRLHKIFDKNFVPLNFAFDFTNYTICYIIVNVHVVNFVAFIRRNLLIEKNYCAYIYITKGKYKK